MFAMAIGPPSDFDGDISIHMVMGSFVGSSSYLIIGATSGITGLSVL